MKGVESRFGKYPMEVLPLAESLEKCALILKACMYNVHIIQAIRSTISYTQFVILRDPSNITNVIIGLGVWVKKMAIFAYSQYIEDGWVRKSPQM